MKVQKTGPDSILLVLNATELQESGKDLRRRARDALASEGIPTGESPEVTAYTAGDQTVVFVCAGAQDDTYFGFDSADDLLDAAYEASRLFPDTGASLYRVDGRLYLATTCRHAGRLLGEYAGEILKDDAVCGERERLIAKNAFQILSGRC